MAKILFLAQFAPTNGKKVIPLSSEEKFYAETYHLPICDILEKYGYDYVTSSDVKELIQNYAQYDLVWSVYCLLYTSPSPRDGLLSRMPSSA